MSGPTNRRFVRSAWTLLAFQFVAACGALALAVWASTRVQALIDQRDMLQARVTQLEAHPAPAEPVPEAGPVSENVTMPAEPPVTTVREPAPTPPPTRLPSPRDGGSGVRIHTAPPPPVVIETPPSEPPVIYEPPVRYVPPREPPVRYIPPRQPPVRYVPPREPPVRYNPPRQPPVTYVPPRQPPVIVRPNFPTRPTPAPQQPVPGATIRPIRPSGVTIVRPVRPIVTQPQGALVATRPATNAQPVTPRRIRRPRPTDTDPQQNPPK